MKNQRIRDTVTQLKPKHFSNGGGSLENSKMVDNSKPMMVQLSASKRDGIDYK
jgi:hypothetical protein